MAASHRMRGDDAGTSNTLQVKASGVLAVVLWPMLRIATAWALQKENCGLKARYEAPAERT